MLLVDKQRVKQCFRQSPEDALGSWYGGLCGPVSDDLAVVGYDDGELITQQINELRGVFEMGKFMTHSMTGLVHDQPTSYTSTFPYGATAALTLILCRYLRGRDGLTKCPKSEEFF